jgi:hypothetical protein
MLYSSFTLDEVEQRFDLKLKTGRFLPVLETIAPSNLLQQFLATTLPLAQEMGSEKARSEFIIAPILVELRTLLANSISIFSGEDFTVDRELGLNGICDFLISRSPTQFKINAPIVALVEAKKGVLKDGWGQCIAKMVAAQRFNQLHEQAIDFIYGVVTSGTGWQFLQMHGNQIIIDPEEYSLQPLDRLLSILSWTVIGDNSSMIFDGLTNHIGNPHDLESTEESIDVSYIAEDHHRIRSEIRNHLWSMLRHSSRLAAREKRKNIKFRKIRSFPRIAFNCLKQLIGKKLRNPKDNHYQATTPITFYTSPLRSMDEKSLEDLKSERASVEKILKIDGIGKIYLEDERGYWILKMEGASSKSSILNTSFLQFLATFISFLIIYIYSEAFTIRISEQDLLKQIAVVSGFTLAISKAIEVTVKLFWEERSQKNIMSYKYCIFLLESSMRELSKNTS